MWLQKTQGLSQIQGGANPECLQSQRQHSAAHRQGLGGSNTSRALLTAPGSATSAHTSAFWFPGDPSTEAAFKRAASVLQVAEQPGTALTWLMGIAAHTGSMEKSVISPSAFAAMENCSSGDKQILSAATAAMDLCSLQGFRSWQQITPREGL